MVYWRIAKLMNLLLEEEKAGSPSYSNGSLVAKEKRGRLSSAFHIVSSNIVSSVDCYKDLELTVEMSLGIAKLGLFDRAKTHKNWMAGSGWMFLRR
ncbi:hypothetical protein SLA2020_254390 [Shorea laevis]